MHPKPHETDKIIFGERLIRNGLTRSGAKEAAIRTSDHRVVIKFHCDLLIRFPIYLWRVLAVETALHLATKLLRRGDFTARRVSDGGPLATHSQRAKA